LHNLALIVERLGESDEAEKHYERAVEVLESAADRDHRVLAACRGNLTELRDRRSGSPAPVRPSAGTGGGRTTLR
jgi:hypothetical protein